MPKHRVRVGKRRIERNNVDRLINQLNSKCDSNADEKIEWRKIHLHRDWCSIKDRKVIICRSCADILGARLLGQMRRYRLCKTCCRKFLKVNLRYMTYRELRFRIEKFYAHYACIGCCILESAQKEDFRDYRVHCAYLFHRFLENYSSEAEKI